MSNKQDYVDLGLNCADICVALDRGMDGKGLGDISPSVREAANQLTTYVKPAVHSWDSSPTAYLMAGLLRRSKGRLQNGAGVATFPDFSMRVMTRTRLPPGSWNSTGYFRSSLCV